MKPPSRITRGKEPLHLHMDSSVPQVSSKVRKSLIVKLRIPPAKLRAARSGSRLDLRPKRQIAPVEDEKRLTASGDIGDPEAYEAAKILLSIRDMKVRPFDDVADTPKAPPIDRNTTLSKTKEEQMEEIMRSEARLRPMVKKGKLREAIGLVSVVDHTRRALAENTRKHC